jgi:XTP/dITP diphosphohydrolase
MILVLATKNSGKIREIKNALDLPGLRIRSLQDFPDLPEVVEDGQTFLDNAFKKAHSCSQATGKAALADDSGLEVDFLHGAPGVFSARFSGPDATDQTNNQKLLSLLEDVPGEKRTAHFFCQMVLYLPDGTWIQTEGFCPGVIAREPRGTQGFGYDPVFYLPEFGKTMAELPLEEKNRISHRARALEKIRVHLWRILKAGRGLQQR